MSSVSIRRRMLPSGDERFDVRFRRGGRQIPSEHGGTFRTRADAEHRADLIRSELSIPLASIGPLLRSLDGLTWTWVYFVQEGRHGPVKIGRTSTPRLRLQSLRIASPRDLRLIGLWWAPEQFEAALHEMFSALRLRGEWFSPTKELLRFARHPAFHSDEALAEVTA